MLLFRYAPQCLIGLVRNGLATLLSSVLSILLAQLGKALRSEDFGLDSVPVSLLC